MSLLCVVVLLAIIRVVFYILFSLQYVAVVITIAYHYAFLTLSTTIQVQY